MCRCMEWVRLDTYDCLSAGRGSKINYFVVRPVTKDHIATGTGVFQSFCLGWCSMQVRFYGYTIFWRSQLGSRRYNGDIKSRTKFKLPKPTLPLDKTWQNKPVKWSLSSWIGNGVGLMPNLFPDIHTSVQPWKCNTVCWDRSKNRLPDWSRHNDVVSVVLQVSFSNIKPFYLFRR